MREHYQTIGEPESYSQDDIKEHEPQTSFTSPKLDPSDLSTLVCRREEREKRTRA